jgi:hypothetical protein
MMIKKSFIEDRPIIPNIDTEQNKKTKVSPIDMSNKGKLSLI